VVGVPKMGAILPEGLKAFAARRLGSPTCAALIAAFWQTRAAHER
jgi:hypothetical protein